MNPLILLALQETPALIARLKELFAKQNPDAPGLTDADAIAAYQSALASALAQDDAWLAAHPAE
jgi:cytochrome c peroxidase